MGIYEKRQKQPILPLDLFKNKVRFGAYLVRALFMMAMLLYWFLLPQVLQAEYGFSALKKDILYVARRMGHADKSITQTP